MKTTVHIKEISQGLNTYILSLWGLTLQIQVQRRRKAILLQIAWFAEHLERHLAKEMSHGLVYRLQLFWCEFAVDSDSNLSTRIYSNSAETQNDFLCSFLLAASLMHPLKFGWWHSWCQLNLGDHSYWFGLVEPHSSFHSMNFHQIAFNCVLFCFQLRFQAHWDQSPAQFFLWLFWSGNCSTPPLMTAFRSDKTLLVGLD